MFLLGLKRLRCRLFLGMQLGLVGDPCIYMCYMGNRLQGLYIGVVLFVPVVAFIKMLLNELRDLQEEEERSIRKIDEELYGSDEKTEE